MTVCVSYRLGFDGFGWIEGAPSNRARARLAAGAGVGPDQHRRVRRGPLAGHHRRPVGGWRCRAHAAGDGGRSAPLRPGLQPVRSARRRPRGEGARSGARSWPSGPGWHRRSTGSGPCPRAGCSSSRTASRRRDESVDPLARLASLTDGLTFGPVVDGDLLRRPTLESLRLGVGADKELVAGATEDEFPIGLGEDARLLDGLPAAAVLGEAGLDERHSSAYLEAHQGSFDVAGRPGPAHRPGVPQSGAGRRRRAARRANVALPVRVRLTDACDAAIHCIDVPVLVRLPGLRPRHGAGRAPAAADRWPTRRTAPRWPSCHAATLAGRPTRATGARSWSSGTRRGWSADGVPRRPAAARLTALSRDGPRGGAARPR